MQAVTSPTRNAQIERVSFAILLIISLIPVFQPAYFLTLDGPAHLYNSRLIRELFTGNELVSSFFQWNTRPEPNWSGHFFMALAGWLLPASFTIKLLIALILVGTATGFRQLILASGANAWMSWLVFPWLYHFPLMMGFLNYSIGVALFSWILVLWQQADPATPRKMLGLFLLLTCSYFSHLMLFGITLMSMGIVILKRPGFQRRLLKLFLIAVPFIAAGLLFLRDTGSGGMRGTINFLPLNELLLNFGMARPLIIFHMENEMPAGIAYAVFFGLLMGFALLSKHKTPAFFHAAWFAAVMIVLHFVFPDDFGGGGIITVRLAQLSFMGLIWMIACCKLKPLVTYIAAVASITFSFIFYLHHKSATEGLSNDAANYVKAASGIPEGSVVLPLNYSGNWLHSNLMGFAGAQLDLLLLDNYEADMKYFPLHWKTGLDPKAEFGNYASSNNPCIHFDKLAAHEKLPDAVLCWYMPEMMEDSCFKEAKSGLEKYYALSYQDDFSKVYLLK